MKGIKKEEMKDKEIKIKIGSKVNLKKKKQTAKLKKKRKIKRKANKLRIKTTNLGIIKSHEE
jgi:hypothetical protein